MLKKLTFLEDHRCFKKGDEFEFREGVNLLVGEQGTGKSTIFEQVRAYAKKLNACVQCKLSDVITMYSFDFEKDTPRGKSHFKDDKDMMSQIVCLFASHGQVNLGILRSLGETKGCLFLLDEPDMSLSIRSCHKLVKLLKKAAENNCQVLAAVHNPIIISAFDDVLSLEHRKWMKSEDFVKCHNDE